VSDESGALGPECSVERSLEVLGERWAFLIIREAFYGRTRFREFQQVLGVSTSRLSARLNALVDAGVLERRSYRPDGERERQSYHLTEAGKALEVVLGALQQWGDVYRPRAEGPSRERRSLRTGERLSVAFVDAQGQQVPLGDVTILSPR
jgi:DNA-binding HxlR family transcriptional regulator